jgi:hypothetical protein
MSAASRGIRTPASSPAEHGTYAGLIRKVPYLQDLGVTTVELLPVFAFDEQDAPVGLVNDWGYQPVSFVTPHPGYSSRQAPTEVLDDFRDLVKDCIAQASRSFSMSSSTTPPKAARTDRPSAFAGSRTRPTTFSTTTRRRTPTIPAAAIPSTPTSRWSTG